jgi:hypothetical protein
MAALILHANDIIVRTRTLGEDYRLPLSEHGDDASNITNVAVPTSCTDSDTEPLFQAPNRPTETSIYKHQVPESTRVRSSISDLACLLTPILYRTPIFVNVC